MKSILRIFGFATLTFILFVWVYTALGDELPDMPKPKPVETYVAPEHKFYDRQAKIELAAAITMAAFDIAQTCHNLANGGREYFLPTQSCAKTNALLFGQVAIQELIVYGLHRHGHHKLERYARLFTVGANLEGVIYSKAHGAF